MVSFSYASYRWGKNQIEVDTFYQSSVTISYIKDSIYKPKRERKDMRLWYFAKGFMCARHDARVYLNYDLDIKHCRIHARITANYPISSMNHKQLVKYKTQVIHERLLAKIMRSQLNFRII
jgi:hypothetical protein